MVCDSNKRSTAEKSSGWLWLCACEVCCLAPCRFHWWSHCFKVNEPKVQKVPVAATVFTRKKQLSKSKNSSQMTFGHFDISVLIRFTCASAAVETFTLNNAESVYLSASKASRDDTYATDQPPTSGLRTHTNGIDNMLSRELALKLMRWDGDKQDKQIICWEGLRADLGARLRKSCNNL